MARKRMLDPEFFMDTELIKNLDITGRLLYIGMWTIADDGGLLEKDSLALKIRLFPADDITTNQIDGYIDTLIDNKKLIPYEVNGKEYIWLKNFLRHQKLDKPSRSNIPLPSWLKYIEGEKRHECKYEIDSEILNKILVGDMETTCSGHVPPRKEVEVEEKRSEIEENINVEDSDESPSSEPQEDGNYKDDVNYQAAIYLRGKILELNPKCKVPNNDYKSMQKWINDLRLIFERDKRTKDEFANIVKFIFEVDDFWCAQIQSPSSLRKHWDKIYAKMQTKTRAAPNNQNSFKAQVDRMKGW